jgi:hypothetical protein
LNCVSDFGKLCAIWILSNLSYQEAECQHSLACMTGGKNSGCKSILHGYYGKGSKY